MSGFVVLRPINGLEDIAWNLERINASLNEMQTQFANVVGVDGGLLAELFVAVNSDAVVRALDVTSGPASVAGAAVATIATNQPPTATDTTAGLVRRAAAVSDAAETTASVRTQLNALLAGLRAAGVVTTA